jgi:CRISPR-associated protein Cmr3
MMRVFIEPCDIVFFRDDLPFGVDGSQFGRCQFPPRPSVIAGALRTKVLASQGIDFDAFRRGDEIAQTVRTEIGHGTAVGDRHALSEGTFRLVALHLGHRSDGIDHACYRVGRDLVVAGKKAVSASTGSESPRLLSPATAGWVSGPSSLNGLAPLAIVPGAEPANGWL